MRGKRLLTKGKCFLLLTVLLLCIQTVYADSAYQNLLPVDKLNNGGDVSYAQQVFASIITAIPTALMALLNIQDVDTLVFGKNDMVYATFPSEVWKAASQYYDLSGILMGFLLALAVVIWGLLFLYQAVTAGHKRTIREMTEGILIYIGMMMGGSYLLELFFKINSFIVQFAKAAMTLFNIPSDIKFLDLVTALQNTPSIGGAIIFLVVVFSVGILNYQYALRMLVLILLIILLPGVAYFSIYPWSRRAIDMWFREFSSQVFENAGHALAFSLFLVLIHLGVSNWVLFAFLFGLPRLAGMIRVLFGAPVAGGSIGTMAGMGSMASLMSIASAMTGSKAGMLGGMLGGGKLGAAAALGGNLTQQASSGVGQAMSSMMHLHGGLGGTGLLQNIDKKALAKKALQFGAKSTVGLAGAMAMGAMTGNGSAAVNGFRMGFQGAEGIERMIKTSATAPQSSESSPMEGVVAPVQSTLDNSGMGVFGADAPNVNWVAGSNPPAALPTYFSNLGFSAIPKNVSAVNQKMRTLAKTMHPDAGGDPRAFAKLTESAAMARRYFSNQPINTTSMAALTAPLQLRTSPKANTIPRLMGKYRVGQEVTAYPTKMTDFGAYFSTDDGFNGFLRNQDMQTDLKLNLTNIVEKRLPVQLQVSKFDYGSGKVSFAQTKKLNTQDEEK